MTLVQSQLPVSQKGAGASGVLIPTPAPAQKLRGVSMVLVTGLVLTYRCSSCHHTTTAALHHHGMGALKKVLERGSKLSTCPVCCRETLRMISTTIRRSSTVYGGPDGVWTCTWHDDLYYPPTIEQAFNDTSSQCSVGASYKYIASLGLPLKCPKCGSLLKYYTNRNEAACTVKGWTAA